MQAGTLSNVLRKLWPSYHKNTLHLPTSSEIIQYVTSDQHFLEKLFQAAQITRDQRREASLELQIDTVEGRWYLSEVGIGTEIEAAGVRKTHPYNYQDYITALHIHSHPAYTENGVIFPSGGDLWASLAVMSRNVKAWSKYSTGHYHSHTLKEAIDITQRDLKWSHQNAVIGIKDDNVALLLYENNPTAFQGDESKTLEPKTQEEVMRTLRSWGFAMRLFKYSKSNENSYTIIEEYAL